MPPVVLYLVTVDWYFWSHRLDLARSARDAGYRVVVATRTLAHRKQIEAEGFECIDLPFERSLRHLWQDIQAIFAIAHLVRQLNPTLVHVVALKPILLSVLAVILNPSTRFLHAVAGLGSSFTARGWRAAGVRWMLTRVMRLVINRRNAWLLVQNEDDRELLRGLSIGRTQTYLIPGSGVDIELFYPTPLPNEVPLVVLPARMLRNKGVADFAQAAKLVKHQLPSTRFALVGSTDVHNPDAYTREQLAAFEEKEGIEWWGASTEMPAVYKAATIVCFPSYREGLPKVLLEAAACSRPLVTYDVPGCREVCQHGENGLTVPAHDIGALANAICELLRDRHRAEAMGRAGRQLIEAKFASDVINRQFIQLYSDMASTVFTSNNKNLPG